MRMFCICIASCKLKFINYFRHFVHMFCVTRVEDRRKVAKSLRFFSVECCASFSLHVLLGMFERCRALCSVSVVLVVPLCFCIETLKQKDTEYSS